MRPVLVIDNGAQNAQLIARRVRDAGYYSELVPHSWPAEKILAKEPLALILSGGPASVYAPGAPQLDRALLEAGIPVLGICYGFQQMTHVLGGTVEETGKQEYGQTGVQTVADSLVTGAAGQNVNVWMSHGDSVTAAPEGFTVTATSPGAKVAAFENRQARLFGVQWHPEAKHSEAGQEQIVAFLRDGAGLEPNWSASSVIDEQIAKIRKQVGDKHAIVGLSGGVDSSVAAALVHRAIGDQLTAVFVDHGLLRKGEVEQVVRDYAGARGMRILAVDESERFLSALAGVTDPEEKRKIIGREFIRSFEAAQRKLVEEAGAEGKDIKFLVQGTLYPDVVESGGGDGTANIKSHHNVGGLPDDLEFELIEPLRDLFKDEVRAIGEELGLGPKLVWRQPFPGPGLGIRIVGEITRERLDILREADAIVREELSAAGLDREIWQCPVVLLADVRSVGVQGDGRTYGHPIVLRPVSSEDAMSADWSRIPYDLLAKISNRITNEVKDINRVVLDVTSKPPGTIEWE
ncbi:glutamine-hydrolyzing GMP synthase [Trueperella bialowiezensis]|uniref:glutamine-hydrolyzing GMP synthase n=1 Tax=Trueperella bialowiezensis TaxID=312285 RepID=UPI000F82D68D|nr:glutamine-hydrolyzing GMP synthase [Trueperella bialowiezensis]